MAAETVYSFTLISFQRYCFVNTAYLIFLFLDNNIKNQEIKTDRNRDKGNTKQTLGDSLIADYIDRILVISSGTLLSLSLLLLIGRQVVKLRRSEINNTSEEMTEFHSILCEGHRTM